MSITPIKFHLGGDCRRISVNVPMPFSRLDHHVRTAFGKDLFAVALRKAAKQARPKATGYALSFRYTDDEDDVVTVTNDVELAEAFKVHETMGKLARFTIVVRPQHGKNSKPNHDSKSKAGRGAECENWRRNLNNEGKLKAKFIADVSLEDASVVQAGTTLTKTWRLDTLGTVWPAGVAITFVGGRGGKLGIAEDARTRVVTTAPTRGTVDISVALTVPAAAGRCVGYWRLVTPEGEKFGHRLWADIIAVADATRDLPKLDAQFVQDVTLEDGAEVELGQGLIKTWRVDTAQGEAWPEGIELVHVAGHDFGCSKVALPAAKGEFDVSLKLTAPTGSAGRVRGAWRFVGPDGMPFGHTIWVDVTVVGSAAAAAAADVAEESKVEDEDAEFEDAVEEAEAEVNKIGAKFLADVTLEDGAEVQAGAKATKTWRIEATGEGWPAGAKLVHVKGHTFGNAAEVEVAAAKGGVVDISVELAFPEKAGRYVGAWKLVDAAGAAILAEDGNPMHIWVDLNVKADEPENFFEPAHGGTPGHYWADRAYQIVASQEHFDIVMSAPLSDRQAEFERLCVALAAAKKAEEFEEAEAEANTLGAKFVADVTLEDGAEVQAGAKATKTWRIEATGEGWPAGAKLVHFKGHTFGADGEVEVAAAKGGVVDISVELAFPEKAGRYVGAWKLVDAAGAAILAEDGNPMRIWVDLNVKAAKPEKKAKEAWAAQGFKPYGAKAPDAAAAVAAASDVSSEEEWTSVAPQPQSHRQPKPVALPGLADAALVVPADEGEGEAQVEVETETVQDANNKEIEMLRSMGFTHPAAELTELLTQHKGDVGAVIARLLQ